ncbi:hypothetical protein [Marinobacter subterrani]|uniref:hypothetical protein n=1 Tax=Marinobacter subterrani TaxID=1658765 RepID=UPI002354B2B2|nr:hypothetical protein [Marinobacter subterrani]
MPKKTSTPNTLTRLARAINESWEARESVDWQEAEDMIGALQTLDRAILDASPDLRDILDYASEEDDWDSGEVATWPTRIEAALIQP